MSTITSPSTDRSDNTVDAPPGDDVRTDTASVAIEDKVAANEQIDQDKNAERRLPTDEAPEDPTLEHKLTMALAVFAPFLGMIGAIVLLWQWGFMGWLYLGMFLGGWVLTALGITVGFHRLMAHRSFDTYAWVRVFWMVVGALSVQGSPIIWCAVHRRHHARSDKVGDPHSPHLHGHGWWNSFKGFVHAHTGWLFTGHWTTPELRRYVPDLLGDRLLVAFDKRYYVFVLASLMVPAAIGGLATMSWQGAMLGVLWGGLARVFFTHHVTWSINSVSHVWGKREYESGDQSRNNVLCGVLAQGEGWHNNHHAFPTSARHGLKWWQFDLSWIIIRGMQLVGLAWNVRLPSKEALDAKRIG